MGLGTLIKKFRDLRRITQKALGERCGLDDVRIRQYELDMRKPKDDMLEDIASALHVMPEYFKDPEYPYDEHDLARFLFKLDDTIEVNIREIPITEGTDRMIHSIYFGSEAILRINFMLQDWKKMKEKYNNGEISREALEDWKANYPESAKKDYVPKEESNIKFVGNSITVKIPPK